MIGTQVTGPTILFPVFPLDKGVNFRNSEEGRFAHKLKNRASHKGLQVWSNNGVGIEAAGLVLRKQGSN
jgi:hypothetical protein